MAIIISVVVVLAVAFFFVRKVMGIVWWLLGGIILALIIFAISGFFFDKVSLPFALPPLMEKMFGISGRLIEDMLEVLTNTFRLH